MSLMRAILFACAAFSATSALSSSETNSYYTAEAMLQLCEGTKQGVPDEVQSLICTFRLQGLAEAMGGNCQSMKEGYRPAPYLSIAAPPSRGAIRQAFKNYAEAHPELWGEWWSSVAAIALAQTFPCVE